MDELIRDMFHGGKDVNEILDMPYSFLLGILREKLEPERVGTLLEAFGS